MADTDDIVTRLALLERTMVSRDMLGEREDKLMDRLERMLTKHETRIDEALQHGLKVYGHETSDQMLKLRTRIHEERDAKLAAEIATLTANNKPKNDLLTRWGLPLGAAAVVGGPGTVDLFLRFLGAVS
jgi:hypothetical protein